MDEDIATPQGLQEVVGVPGMTREEVERQWLEMVKSRGTAASGPKSASSGPKSTASTTYDPGPRAAEHGQEQAAGHTTQRW